MKKSDIDYKNYDRLDIYAKKEKVEGITKCYESFSWELKEKHENNKYADTIELTFIRPHKIANKDDLLYSQIEMENALNALGKLSRNKHAICTMVGLALGILSVGILAMGIYCLLSIVGTLGWVLFGMGIGIGIGLGIFSWLYSKKIYNDEEKKYKIQRKKLENTIENICKLAKTTAGENYADKN